MQGAAHAGGPGVAIQQRGQLLPRDRGGGVCPVGDAVFLGPVGADLVPGLPLAWGGVHAGQAGQDRVDHAASHGLGHAELVPAHALEQLPGGHEVHLVPAPVVLSVVKRLGVVDDLDRRAAAELQLHAVFCGLAVLDELLRAVLMDDDGHSAGGDVLHRDLDGRLVGVVRHVDLDLCGGVGVLRCLDLLHGNGHGFALLLRLLHIPVAELGAGLGRGVALGVGFRHRGPRGPAAGAGRGGLRLGPIGLGLCLRGGPVGVLHRVGLGPRRHRPRGAAGAGLVPEGDGAGEVVVILLVLRCELPGVGGVGFDFGADVDFLPVSVHPLDITIGLNGTNRQVSIFEGLAALSDCRIAGGTRGSSLGNRHLRFTNDFDVVGTISRSEYPTGLMLASHQNLVGIFPSEGACDRVLFVCHGAREGDVTQLVAVGEVGFAQRGGAGGDLLVGRGDVEGQGDVIIVFCCNNNGNRANSFFFCGVDRIDRDGKNAVLNFCSLSIVVA